MLKAISYWSFQPIDGKPCPPEKAMQLAKEKGYDAIELCCDLEGPLNPKTPPKECQLWRESAERIGIQLQSVASGMSWGCCPTDINPDIRKQAIANQKAALDRCAWLGAKSLLHVPGAAIIPWRSDFAPVRYDKAVEWAREAVQILGEYAANLDLELCVENVWNGLFYSPLELRDFVDSFENPSVGVYFDIGNILNHQQWPPHWIEILGKRIRRVHVKDFKLSVGTLDGFCDLTEGDVPWKETMAALRSIGYDKTMTAEMLPPDETILDRTSKALDRIFAL